MIYKVLYQHNFDEIPVREKTDSLFIEAENEREVRQKLAKDKLNIEYIQPLSDAHLSYEKKREDFRLENR